MSIDEYCVFIENFAQTHFIKSFHKKYKSKHWEITLKAICQILTRYDNIAPNHISTDGKLKIICPCGGYMLIKLDFRIAGDNRSAKSSGNRVIAAVNKNKREIKILLIYSKNDIGPPNETAKWQSMVKNNYPEFIDL